MATPLLERPTPVLPTRLQEAMQPSRIAADRLALAFTGRVDNTEIGIEKRRDDGLGDH